MRTTTTPTHFPDIEPATIEFSVIPAQALDLREYWTVEEPAVDGPVSWAEFATEASELASLGEGRFDATGLCLVGSLRRDGWPRISPVEPLISHVSAFLRPRQKRDASIVPTAPDSKSTTAWKASSKAPIWPGST